MPIDELAQTRRERDALLDELAMVYQQLQNTLEANALEQRVTYVELERRHAELVDRLREVEDLNNRLQTSQKMLRQSERLSAVGQLAAMIAHEIRGPLTGICGQAEMLLMQETDTTERQRHGLDIILTAAWRLNELTDRVLRFTRGDDAGVTAVVLDDVVARVVELLGPLAPAESAIELRLAPGVPAVRGNASELEQVLTNLMLNGLDAIAETGGRLVASTGVCHMPHNANEEDTREDGGWSTAFALPAGEFLADALFAYAEIADDGAGIDPQLLPRLFEPLFTTKPIGKGTGLGLAICRNIAREMGGNLRVSTRSGVGSRVRLFVPLMPAVGIDS